MKSIPGIFLKITFFILDMKTNVFKEVHLNLRQESELLH